MPLGGQQPDQFRRVVQMREELDRHDSLYSSVRVRRARELSNLRGAHRTGLSGRSLALMFVVREEIKAGFSC